MAKRIFDLVVTLVLAPIWIPAMLVMAAVLAVELKGNPFFIQQRVGRHGRRFRMRKLRTMRHLAPGEEEHYVVDDFSKFVFAPTNAPHPRVTRIGAFARRTSLDELPNLFNVLRGDMSLVGPRPEIPEIVAQFPEAYHRRHEVPPGIAGLAQANGRSDLTYDEMATYDLEYVDHHSVLTDIHILAKTALAVVRGSGAR